MGSLGEEKGVRSENTHKSRGIIKSTYRREMFSWKGTGEIVLIRREL